MKEIIIMTIVFSLIGFIIISCLFGFIMKHFIREAIKEAFEDMESYKKK